MAKSTNVCHFFVTAGFAFACQEVPSSHPSKSVCLLTIAVPWAPYAATCASQKTGSFSWHRSSSASRMSLISQMPFADAESVRFSRACRNSVCFAISVVRRAWRKDPLSQQSLNAQGLRRHSNWSTSHGHHELATGSWFSTSGWPAPACLQALPRTLSHAVIDDHIESHRS